MHDNGKFTFNTFFANIKLLFYCGEKRNTRTFVECLSVVANNMSIYVSC